MSSLMMAFTRGVPYNMLGGNLGSVLYGDVSVMFKGGIWILIAPVPGHCILVTF